MKAWSFQGCFCAFGASGRVTWHCLQTWEASQIRMAAGPLTGHTTTPPCGASMSPETPRPPNPHDLRGLSLASDQPHIAPPSWPQLNIWDCTGMGVTRGSASGHELQAKTEPLPAFPPGAPTLQRAEAVLPLGVGRELRPTTEGPLERRAVAVKGARETLPGTQHSGQEREPQLSPRGLLKTRRDAVESGLTGDAQVGWVSGRLPSCKQRSQAGALHPGAALRSLAHPHL